MKKYILLTLLLPATHAFACPNFSGTYETADDEFTFTQTKGDCSQITFSNSKEKFTALINGSIQPDIDNGFAKYSWRDNDLVIKATFGDGTETGTVLTYELSEDSDHDLLMFVQGSAGRAVFPRKK